MNFISKISKISKVTRLGIQLKILNSSHSLERKKIAADQIVHLLGTEKGILLKIGQFLGVQNDELSSLRSVGSNEQYQLAIEDILEQLANEWKCDPHLKINTISETGVFASLSQVHHATLKSTNKDVAIKVQIPWIEEDLRHYIDLFSALPKLGPVKKWDFPLTDYKAEFQEALKRELDYGIEIENLEAMRFRLGSVPEVKIPNIFSDLCTKKVLVLEWCDGISFEEAQKVANPQEKKWIAEKLLEIFLFQILRAGLLQSDFNEGNFLFTLNSTNRQITLLDFGGVIELNSTQKSVLYDLIKAQVTSDELAYVDMLVALGFDAEKLQLIEDRLPALISVVLQPFRFNKDFDLTDWNLNHAISENLGELKWWFRSAGSAKFFHIVRSFGLLIQLLQKLDARINWQSVLSRVEQGLSSSKNKWKAKPKIEIQSLLSRVLKIEVMDFNGQDLVNLTLPIQAIDNLEGLMSPEVLANLERQGITLTKVRGQFLQSNGKPGVLFESQNNTKRYRISAE